MYNNDKNEYDFGDLEDLQKTVVSNIKKSRQHFSEWRNEAKEAYDLYSGHHWSEEDVMLLQEQNRPAVTFNRIARTINGVLGLEVQNRQETLYKPIGVEDSPFSDIYSDASKWVRDKCDAGDEESESFADSLICGLGATHTSLNYDIDPDGQIIIERLDPLDIGVDHTCKKRNCDDSRFRYYVRSYTKKEFIEEWGEDNLPARGKFDGFSEVDELEEDQTRDGYLNGDDIHNAYADNEIQVAQYQYFQRLQYRYVEDDQGQRLEVPENKFKKLKPLIEQKGWSYTKNTKKRKIYLQVFCTGEKILEKSVLECGGFTLNFITGLRDRNKNIWFGLVRLMKDPQMWANKWLSQVQHILNTQAKTSKILYEQGAFTSTGRAKQEWAKPDSMIEMTPGSIANNKVQMIPPPGYPQGIDRLLQYAVDAINDTPGVNMELLGLADRNQPGILEASRKQSGITVLAVFFDSLRRYRKEQGRILAEHIRLYISDGRLIRITSKDNVKYLPLHKDKMTFKYDVSVDEAPNSPSMKDKTFQILSTILPIALQSGIPVPPDLLEYAPLPTQLVDKWKEYINQINNNPETAEAKELQKAGTIADIEVKNAQAMKTKADAAKTMSEAQSNSAQAQIEEKIREFQMQRNQMLLDAELKIRAKDQDIALKQEEMARKFEFDQYKLRLEEITKYKLEELRLSAQERMSDKAQMDSQVNNANMEAFNSKLEELAREFQSNLQDIKEKVANKRITINRNGGHTEALVEVA